MTTPLQFEYDTDRDELTVEGIRYAGEIFRAWSSTGLPIGSWFKLTERASYGGTRPVLTILHPGNRTAVMNALVQEEILHRAFMNTSLQALTSKINQQGGYFAASKFCVDIKDHIQDLQAQLGP